MSHLSFCTQVTIVYVYVINSGDCRQSFLYISLYIITSQLGTRLALLVAAKKAHEGGNVVFETCTQVILVFYTLNICNADGFKISSLHDRLF